MKPRRFVLSALFSSPLIAAALAAIGGAMPTAASAQTSFPNKPIEIVVAYPAGGGIDSVARLIGPEIAARIGQSVVVVNRPGAAGSIGTTMAANAAADGHTLLLSGSNVILSPLVDPKLQFRVTDFEPVALLTETPYALAVSRHVPATSLQEFLAFTRENPGLVNYGSTGPGSVQHLIAELLKKAVGADWTHVPYQGGAAPLRDLESGQIHIMFSNPIPLLPYLQSDRARVIGMATDERIAMMPEVPTLKEQGVRDFSILSMTGLLAPKGAPIEARQRLSEVVMEVMALPKVREKLAEQGVLLNPMPHQDFGRYLVTETERWQRIVAEIGFKPNQ